MVNSKFIAQVAVLIAMIVSIGVVGYQEIMGHTLSIFFSSLLTLTLGKYINQLGFSQGTETTPNVTPASINDVNTKTQA